MSRPVWMTEVREATLRAARFSDSVVATSERIAEGSRAMSAGSRLGGTSAGLDSVTV